jgi:hypothetical protein
MLVASPLLIVFAYRVSSDLAFSIWVMSMLAVAGVHLIVGQMVRELGDRRKERLNSGYGGRPAIQMLQLATGSRWSLYAESIAILCSQLGLPLPESCLSRDDGRARAEDYVVAVGLIEETLDWSKNRALRSAQFQFEFLLNCLALRPIGIASCASAMLLALSDPASTAVGSSSNGVLTLAMSVRAGSIQQALIPAIVMWVWLFYITAVRVRRAQSRYDRFLLAAVVRTGRKRQGAAGAPGTSRRSDNNMGNGTRRKRSKNP